MIRNLVHTALVIALCTTGTAEAQSLPNRVAVGDVTPFSAVVWARASAPGRLRFDISPHPTFQSFVQQRYDWVSNVAVPAKAIAGPLAPATTYHYRATDSSGATDTGVFRTSPLPWAETAVRFGVSGDARGELAPFRSISNVPGEGLDFFAILGDTIYADVESPILPGVTQASTLAEFRAKHFENYSAAQGFNGLGDLRASTALLSVIDDHEVTNDFSGGAHPSTDLRFDQTGAFINDTNLFDRGLKAFVEYNPVLPTYYGWTGDPRTAFERKLYRERRHGRTASVLMLDPRSFRDQALPDVTNPLDPSQIGAFQIASFDPTRTMLGAKQLSDLKADLLAAEVSGVLWKFVMVAEPIQNLGVVAASDRFEGYAAERTSLLDFIISHDIKNVVFICADIHGTLVNNITYQQTVGGPQIPTSMFEISTGPIAYDAPFGPTVVQIAAAVGLVTPSQLALYNSLPTVLKDQFVEQLVNAQLLLLGLDPLGLGGSMVNATLLQGSYVATHVYGWTKFEVAAASGTLTVTTYGIDPAQPSAQPAVVSKFAVTPQ